MHQFPRGQYLDHSCSLFSLTIFVMNVKTHSTSMQMTLSCFTSTDDPEAITASQHRDLERMRIWAYRWKLTFEPSKFKVLTISRKRNPTRLDLLFGNTKLAEKENWRFSVSQLTTSWPAQNTSPTFHSRTAVRSREESPTNLMLEVEQQSTKLRYAVWWSTPHSPGCVPAPPS